MTRHLPCSTPACRALGALLPPNPAYPHGEPYLSAQYVERYLCSRCGNNVKLTPAEYHAQKVLTLADYERLGMRDRALRDLVAAGVPEKLKTKGGHVSPAADLFAAGVRTAHDVAELERGE